MNNFLFRNSWWAIRKRPKIKIGFTLFDLIVEIVGVIAVLAMWIILIVTYSGLPDVIPIHYNASGQADHFGGKNSIFILPVVATVVFAGMTILSRFPHVLNYPVKITENNASFQYSNMLRMLRFLKLAIVLLFGYLVLHTAQSADGIGGWFMPVILGVIFVPTIYFLVKSFIYR